MENQNNPPVPSITQLFNLLALRNKLHPKSVLMMCVCVCVCVFLLNFLFKLYNIYLLTFLFKICLFILIPVMCNIFPKRGNATFEIE